jgi:hypothetical protein
MKKILPILFLISFSSQQAQAYDNKNIYHFTDKTLEELLVKCEKYYKQDYPHTPFPEKYQALSKKHKLHYCMRKLLQTGEYEGDVWYRQANIKNSAEYQYVNNIGELPDEYYLIETYEDRMVFIGESLDKKYAENNRIKSQENRKYFSRAGSVLSFLNPVIGWVFTFFGAVS